MADLERIDTLHRSATDRSAIWWLASFPKSGNTWLRIFLSAYGRGGTVNINTPSISATGDLNPYFYQVVSPRPLDQLSSHDILAIRPAALLHMTCMYNNLLVPFFLKTHSIFTPGLIPPDMTNGAIYLVRDPRDVVISYAKHCGESIDAMIERMGRRNACLGVRETGIFQLAGTWSENVKSWMAKQPLPIIVVRYEDMLCDQIGAFRQILKFVGYDIDEDLLARTVASTSFDKLREQEDEFGFAERCHGDRFFNAGKAGGWKDVLTQKQRELIEFDHGKVMKELDYL